MIVWKTEFEVYSKTYSKKKTKKSEHLSFVTVPFVSISCLFFSRICLPKHGFR